MYKKQWGYIYKDRLEVREKTDIRQSDVRPEAFAAFFQTKRTQNICMLSYALTYSNLLSPTSQRLAVHPLSPESETFEPLPLINSNSFCEIALFIFSSILISSSKNVCLLFYAIPRRIVNRQKLYRTKAYKIFPSLEREGDHRRWWKVEASL